MHEPTILARGVAFAWTTTHPLYSPRDEYRLEYEISGPRSLRICATGIGADWSAYISPDASGWLSPGTYRWRAIVEEPDCTHEHEDQFNDNGRCLIGEGYLTVTD